MSTVIDRINRKCKDAHKTIDDLPEYHQPKLDRTAKRYHNCGEEMAWERRSRKEGRE